MLTTGHADRADAVGVDHVEHDVEQLRSHQHVENGRIGELPGTRAGSSFHCATADQDAVTRRGPSGARYEALAKFVHERSFRGAYARFMIIAADRFDEVRRAWVAARQGASSIQRRRGEVLGRNVRARQRAVASAVPDPHDDVVTPPLWLRTAKSPASQVELLLVVMSAVVAPVGWLGGWLTNASLQRTVVMPWFFMQVAAVPVVAGIYGVAEGWLAVVGSDQWWPLTPPKRVITALKPLPHKASHCCRRRDAGTSRYVFTTDVSVNEVQACIGDLVLVLGWFTPLVRYGR
jgi:hypothetical protein